MRQRKRYSTASHQIRKSRNWPIGSTGRWPGSVRYRRMRPSRAYKRRARQSHAATDYEVGLKSADPNVLGNLLTNVMVELMRPLLLGVQKLQSRLLPPPYRANTGVCRLARLPGL